MLRIQAANVEKIIIFIRKHVRQDKIPKPSVLPVIMFYMWSIQICLFWATCDYC